jgi:putative ABC transport system permease protein
VKALVFAARGLWRDWRGGDLRLLTLSLVLAVAAVTAVGFFTDRVDLAMKRQGNDLLAADLVAAAPQALPESFAQEATRLGLRTTRTLSFPSVVVGEQEHQLVQVKAVADGYPLRGRLQIRDEATAAVASAAGPPRPGQVWVEPRLLVMLGVELGHVLPLGQSELRIAGLIELEPDRGGNLFQLAPRLMLNLADIPATGLVTPASRLEHRLLVAGNRAKVEAYRAWLGPRLPPNARLIGIADARPEMRVALDRGGRFLSLAALVAVIVTGAAVALSTRRLVERQADAVAILRCVGASSGFLRNDLILRLVLLILISGVAGAALGYVAQGVLIGLIGDWLVLDLPAASMRPILIGMGTSALTLFGFAFPALSRLPQVPPLRVLRRDLGPTPPGPWMIGLAALAALALLVYWQAGDGRLAAAVLGGVIGLLAVLALLALALVRAAGIAQQQVAGIRRFGLASLSRHPGTTVLQVCGFGVGIMALLLLAVVRVDLLSAWERTLPPDAPNRFLINVLPEQTEKLQEFLETNDIRGSGLHPMIRGRLVGINGQPVDPDSYENPRAQRLAAREFNLSWGSRPQADNRVVAGSWWSDDEAPPQLSVEAGIAESLGIELGDRLTYWVAGREISAPVTSLRSVEWDSFNVNFFVVGSPRTLRDEAATFVTSFHLPPAQEALSIDLVRLFPNITALDVSALMAQVRAVIDRGSLAVEYVFLFTLGAGVLVLYAGIQAGAEGRRREAAILRTLGARRRQLLGAAAVEFSALGLLAGLLAALGAALTGTLVASQILDLDYGFSPWLWVIGVGGSVLGIGGSGLLAAWPVALRPPLTSLRRAE